MPLFIKKNPNPQTLISKVYSSTQPDGYELATEQEVSDWVHEQMLAGWEPTFPDLPIEEQKAIVEQQRNTYREQSLFLKSQVTTLEAEKATLTAEKATANADKDSLTTQVESLTSQLQEVTESKDVLFVKKQAVDHDLVEANAKIAFLESIRQYNPRWTTPDFFINRFTAKEAKAFYSSEDAMIVGGQQLLEAYEQAGWYVDLDDTQVQGLTGYMMQLGMLTAERRTQVLRDATAAEAWYPQ
jgi:hypothetical protein